MCLFSPEKKKEEKKLMQSRKKSSSSEKEKEMKTLQSAKCETAFIKEGGWENTKQKIIYTNLYHTRTPTLKHVSYYMLATTA